MIISKKKFSQDIQLDSGVPTNLPINILYGKYGLNFSFFIVKLIGLAT